MKQSGSSNTLKWPGLLGLALLYAGILVLREQMFPALNGVVQLRPTAGLAVAALILWGRVTVWPIAAGALLAGLFLHGAGGSALALLLAGVSGPLAGVCLLYRQSRFDWRLRRLADYAKLMLCTAGVGGLVAALAGTLTLAAFGLAGGRQPLDLVLTWWAGEALGIAMLTPLILVGRGIKRLWTPAAPLAETVLLLGASFLAGQYVFLGWFHDSPQPVGFWMFVFVTWAALRRERRGAAAVLALFTVQALWGAALQRGFGYELLVHDSTLLWRYLLVLNCSGMAMACYVTEQRLKAAALLRESLALRDRALEKVQEGVALADADRKLTFVNEAFERLTGYTRAELIGKNCAVLQGDKTNKQTAQEIREKLHAGQTFQGDILNYRKDGSTFWNDLSITPIRDATGTVTEFFGVQRDITAEREAALALRQSQEQLNLVLKGSNDGLWDWDPVTDTTERSDTWFQMLGYDKNEFPTNRASWPGLVHPDDLARVTAAMDALLAGEQDRYSMELRLKHHAGHYVSVLSRGYIQRDDAGKPTRICGTTTNLTEQKEREAKLSLAAAVFLQSREGITMTDANRNIIMVNRAFTEITGYSEAEVLGKNPRVLSSGRQDAAYYRAMWHSIETTGQWEGEIWNRRKDGTLYCEWLAISAMRDAKNGAISHYIGSFSDLSDAKAAESRIQWLSQFDALTGLPNASLLRDRTEHSISMVQRGGEPLTMLLLGIDHFKAINDAMGHAAGDALLMEVAKRLRESVREQDTVARLGGKEFVLVLPGTAPDGAAHLANELLWKLAQPYEVVGQSVPATASIGLASYPSNGTDFASLFKSVEIAMHRAQAKGRDCLQFYSDEMYQQVLAHDQMVKALRSAAALDQFQLAYQPLVDLQSGQISGMEALLRWHHPELGQVSPAQFIPVAEEAGLIKAIGQWVLQQACRDIRVLLAAA